MNSLRALIADDEPLARESLAMHLKDIPGLTVLRACSDGGETRHAILALNPDLVFLDIHMPGLTGFEVLKSLEPERVPIIIFVTAYHQYAVEAFRARALDYLTKPIHETRLRETIARAKELFQLKQIQGLNRQLMAKLAQATQYLQEQKPVYAQRLELKARGQKLYLETHRINWIEAADYYVQLHTASHTHLLRQRMHILEKRLDPAHFCRIHRSAIVNISKIKALRQETSGSYSVLLNDGTCLKLSRNRRAPLEERLRAMHS